MDKEIYRKAHRRCSTTNVSFTLDYSSATPPNLTIPWPPNGTPISGTNFTLQGQLDDDTATVTAQIIDTNGDTNTVPGIIERSGLVWVNNMPLAAGTNILIVTATNAAGLSMTTNVILTQSPVLVTMNPLNQFNQADVNVTGTISDPTCTLTVNGVSASPLDTNGDWEAYNVPVSPTGTAVFNAQIFNADSVQIGLQQFSQVQPPMVVLESDSSSQSSDLSHPPSPYVGPPPGPATSVGNASTYWSYLSGGTSTTAGYATQAYLWWVGYTPQPTNGIGTNSSSSIPAGVGAYSAAWEDASYTTPPGGIFEGTISYNNHARVMIAPSGQAPIGQKVLYLVQVQVSGEDGSPNPPIDTVEVQEQTLTSVTNSDGSVWGQTLLVAPAGAYEDVTPDPPGNLNYNVGAAVPTLQIVDNNNNGNVLSGQTTTVIVGQQMNLSCQLNVTNSGFSNSMLTNFQWLVPGYAISNYVVAPDASSATLVTNFPTTNSSAVFYWADGATNLLLVTNRAVWCSATINGVTISNQAVFNVLRPFATVSTQTKSIVMDGPLVHFCQVHPFVAGITFSNTVIVPPSFSGSNEWVQTVDFDVEEYEDTNSFWHKRNTVGEPPFLDTLIPYPPENNNPSATADSPGYGDVGGRPQPMEIIMGEDFTMWLMFRPDGGQWVPLRAVSWNVGATATNSLYDSISGWGIESSSFANPSDCDPDPTMLYPEWNGNITNFIYTTNSVL
jgi:hypothetical protein